MGIIKPRPSGEVAAQLVALTERAIICKECCEALPRAPQGNFLKSSLDLQKLLKMGVVNLPLCWRYVYSPTASATTSPSNKNNASTSLVQARLGQALFLLLVLWTRSVGKRFAQTR